MSFAITWPDVVLVDASLHCVPTNVQTAILADVETLISETNLGTKYDIACKTLAAHMATLYLQSGAQMPAGPVTSDTVGPISTTYAAPASLSTSDPWLASTKHGLSYVRLVRSSIARFPLL